MRLLKTQHSKTMNQGCVATIGNFDGIHLGHQAIIVRLIERASEAGLPSMVVLFEPQPREWFQKEEAPIRLTSLREKYRLLKRGGVDFVAVLRFNQSLANLSPEAFVQQVLLDQLQVKHLIVGDDFKFGRKRAGDVALLKQLSGSLGFKVEQMPSFQITDDRVSSSRIRRCIAQGQLEEAAEYLGHHYSLSGHVAHGDKRGRELGFPTANVFLPHDQAPLNGILAAQVHGLADHPLPAVAYVGRRPAVNGQRTIMEAHLLDFNQDIYGRFIQVDFLTKIRGDQNFDSLEALAEQIARDTEQARAFFAACC